MFELYIIMEKLCNCITFVKNINIFLEFSCTHCNHVMCLETSKIIFGTRRLFLNSCIPRQILTDAFHVFTIQITTYI